MSFACFLVTRNFAKIFFLSDGTSTIATMITFWTIYSWAISRKASSLFSNVPSKPTNRIALALEILARQIKTTEWRPLAISPSPFLIHQPEQCGRLGNKKGPDNQYCNLHDKNSAIRFTSTGIGRPGNQPGLPLFTWIWLHTIRHKPRRCYLILDRDHFMALTQEPVLPALLSCLAAISFAWILP